LHVTRRPDEAQHLRDLALLRRVRDRMDREYAQPLDVEALARGVNMSAGHLSRQFRLAYGESPYSYLMTRRIERDGAAASWRPVRHRGVLRRWLRVVGHLQHPLHRAGRDAAEHVSGTDRRRDGGDSVVRRETGDQTDQESRSANHRAAPSVSAMDITIHSSFLPHDDPDASLAFYRDTLGFEVRLDVGGAKMRWITVGPPNQPDTSIVLYPPAATPGLTDDERRIIAEMMAKGTYGMLLLATKDLDDTFERLQVGSQTGQVEVVQEPTEQPYGVRDCALRDPAGNMVRIQELR